jgi:hypothetical protein
MTGWLAVLIFSLWVLSGIGWVSFCELVEGREMNTLRRAFVLAVWPVFGVVFAVGRVWAGLRNLFGGAG